MPKDQIVKIYEDVENECREIMLKSGGSLSHHHGVGKIRKRFVKDTMSEFGIKVQKEVKEMLDPKNIFAANNTLYRLENEENEELGIQKL